MKLDPTRTALIVIDMQNDFYADGFNAVRRGKPVSQMQALPAKIERFSATLRERGGRIVYTQFVYGPEQSPANFTEIIGATRASNWLCPIGSPGAELAGVNPTPDDLVLQKHTYDCFADTGLLAALRSWNIQNVILSGVRTEICVTYTAGRAFAEGFRTIVAQDLVGTYDNKGELAQAILKNLDYSSFVIPTTSLEF